MRMARQATKKRHGDPCAYCKRPMNMHDKRMYPTRDHVVPRRAEGTVVIWCCWTCNMIKKDRMPDVWAAYMAANPEWWKRGPNPNRRKESAIRRKKITFVALDEQTVRAPQIGVGKPLTGAAKKALLRRVTRPPPPPPRIDMIVYSTDDFENDGAAW